jgi:putative salt-induced outer membrane protein
MEEVKRSAPSACVAKYICPNMKRICMRLLRQAPLTLPLLAALSTPALADAPKADGQWRGLAGASLSLSGGNTESAALLANVNLARQVDGAKTTVQAYINQARSKVDGERDTTANKWGASGQQDLDLSGDWYGFGRLGVDADRLIELKHRSTVAGGVGYHLIRSERHTLDVFSGVSHTRSVYREVQTINDQTGTRFSNTGVLIGEESSHQLNDTVSLKQRLEYNQGLSGDKLNLLRFNGSLNVAMSKATSLSVGLISTYNSKVPPGVKKVDTSLFTGLNVKLGE